MAHYAKVVSGEVVNVIVAEESFFNDFVDTSPGEWIQTSYCTREGIHYQSGENGLEDFSTPSEDQSKALRKNFAGIGYSYDATRDAFIPPKPYNSWTLNEDSCTWQPPVEKPTNGNRYTWNEDTQSWDTEA